MVSPVSASRNGILLQMKTPCTALAPPIRGQLRELRRQMRSERRAVWSTRDSLGILAILESDPERVQETAKRLCFQFDLRGKCLPDKKTARRRSLWWSNLLSSLDQPSAPKAWRPAPAVRPWVGLASACEHPGTRLRRHRSRDSSCRSADADWCLQSLRR